MKVALVSQRLRHEVKSKQQHDRNRNNQGHRESGGGESKSENGSFGNSWSSSKWSSFRNADSIETIEDQVDDPNDQIKQSDEDLQNPSCSAPHQKWIKFAKSLHSRSSTCRLGDLVQILTKLPDDINFLFQRLETTMKIEFDVDTRLKYYKEFTRAALGAFVMRAEEVGTAAILQIRCPEHSHSNLISHASNSLS